MVVYKVRFIYSISTGDGADSVPAFVEGLLVRLVGEVPCPTLNSRIIQVMATSERNIE